MKKEEMKKQQLNNKEIKKDDRIKVSHKFITALSIVSIVGFLSIASTTLFDFNFEAYTEAILMFVIGFGLIFEARLKRLKSLNHGITSTNLTHLITIIIGMIAVLAGIFSIPQIRLDTSGFLAIKGIISIIAIIVIVIQTWIID